MGAVGHGYRVHELSADFGPGVPRRLFGGARDLSPARRLYPHGGWHAGHQLNDPFHPRPDALIAVLLDLARRSSAASGKHPFDQSV